MNEIEQWRDVSVAIDEADGGDGIGSYGPGELQHAIVLGQQNMTMSEQGEPRILATLIGVLILGVLDNGLTQMSVDSYVRQILVGAIIVIAVSASSITKSARR